MLFRGHLTNLRSNVVSKLLGVLVFLAGCGGGGGGGDSSPAASATGAPAVTFARTTIKQVNLSWAAVPTATSFKLMSKPSATESFTQIGIDLPARTTTAEVPIAVQRTDWVNTRLRIDACKSDGCTASNEVGILGSMLDTIGYFNASSNTSWSRGLGLAIALSADGNTLAVGSRQEDQDPPEPIAMVHVCTRSGTP